MSSNTPGRWQAVNLEDVCEIVRGVAFPTTDKTFSPSEGAIACLRTTNVQREVEWDDLWFIPEKHLRHDRQLVRIGDVLISTANSFELVGKVAQVKSLPYRATLGAFISLIRPDDHLNKSFVFYQLTTSAIQSDIRSMASTTTNISNVSTGKLRELPLDVAPLAEQARIVDEIEKQFTRLDAATAALKRVQANLKRYRASVLKAACEGRLVPTEAELARREGRDYEPADKLLQRILRERRARWEADTLAKMQSSGKPPQDDRWKQKYKEPSAPDSANLPPLPEGWCWASLNQVAVSVRNGISVKPTLEQGLAILRISAVRAMSVNLSDVRFLPDNPDFRQYALSENDLLFVRYNGNPDISGRCGRVGVVGGVIVHPDKLIRVDICFKTELSGWVEIAANFGASRRHLELKTRTTAGQTGISGEDIKGIPIPLCPLPEAIRIVEESDRRLSTHGTLQSEIERNELRAKSLRQSILRNAFTGLLVPQDTTDEPASLLLERIRGQRATAGVGLACRTRRTEHANA